MGDFFDEPQRRDRDAGAMGERQRRREAARRRLRRRRRVALALTLAVLLALAAGFVVAPLVRGGETGTAARPKPKRSKQPAAAVAASPSPTHFSPTASPTTMPKTPSPTRTESMPPTYAPTPSPKPTVVKPPPIVNDLVPYGAKRRQQMVAYCRRHYGAAQATSVLKPRAVVLHYTAGGLYSSAHNYFASNTPALGELPGVCAHFIIDKNGRIYRQLGTGVRCRHTIGLNHVAVGIEFVQEAGSGPTWACNQIFNRPRQINAGLRLVRWLRYKYGIQMRDIYGHGTANSSRFFRDLKGWRNDHVDWNAAAIRRFKKKLAAMD